MNRYHETRKQKSVICPAIIRSRHGTSEVDIPFVPGSNEEIVKNVPVLGSWVMFCAGSGVVTGVDYSQVEFCTGTEKQMPICVAIANTVAAENALPCTVITTNSSVKVDKNHKFIRFWCGSDY